MGALWCSGGQSDDCHRKDRMDGANGFKICMALYGVVLVISTSFPTVFELTGAKYLLVFVL